VLPRDGDIPALARELVPDGVDALLDLVNYAPGNRAQGRRARRVAHRRRRRGARPRQRDGHADPENLQRLGALLADGTLHIPVHQTYELAQAPDALAALAGRHTQGTFAIQVS
jgi:NADPH:quinone reductase-like Zn-dependent oxidoreductase